MSRRVPVALRYLTANRRRLIASVAGVGLAVMLILLLQGLWNGIKAETRVYTDNAGGNLYVLQEGARELHDGGVLPLSVVDTVRSTPGVQWAVPVRGSHVILDLHGTKVAPYLVGTKPGSPGGVWALAAGRAPRANDEIVVDSVLAKRHGIDVGDRLDVMGAPFRVVGLSSGTSGFMTQYVFTTHAATDTLFKAPGTTSYVLADASDAAAAAKRLRSQGLNALPADEVGANFQKLAQGIFGGPLKLMVLIAFIAGTLIMALTGYTSVAERRREYGMVKALGAGRRWLVRVAIGQTLGLAVLGLGAGILLFLAGRALIADLRPQFSVVFTGGEAIQAILAAVAMALLAAIVPARRLAKLDPATAYRGS